MRDGIPAPDALCAVNGEDDVRLLRRLGAAFELKDELRQRGYRWDAAGDPKCWWREVPDARRTEEEWWLAGHVYAAEARPRALGPVVERVTWHERYAAAERSS